MKIAVIGPGRWGSFIAWYAARLGGEVPLYGRAGSEKLAALESTRRNEYLSLPDNVALTSRLSDALSADVIAISVGSQSLRALMREIASEKPSGKTFVLCMKGIEIESMKRLSLVADEYVGADNRAAVWLGPGHPQEFVRGVPNCMVIDSADDSVKRELVSALASPLIRFYYGSDLVGNELGAAVKNVVGIAAGFLDGLGKSTLKGALMARGCREVARLIEAEGGDPRSAYGLCHLGDYEATVFSEHSHNRAFGESFARGQSYGALAEGYYTVKAVVGMADRDKVDMPICRAVYNALYGGAGISDEIDRMFERSIKQEF